MLSIGSITVGASGAERRRSAFTLIELIIVLMLLAVILSIAAPSLGAFFRNRSLSDEASRFLAVTEFARQQAMSRGEPMVVWVDPEFLPREGISGYGIRPEIPWEIQEEKERYYALNPQYEIAWDPLFQGPGQRQGEIVFLPDGAIAEESLFSFVIRERSNPNEEFIRVLRDNYGTAYESRRPEDPRLIRRPEPVDASERLYLR